MVSRSSLSYTWVGVLLSPDRPAAWRTHISSSGTRSRAWPLMAWRFVGSEVTGGAVVRAPAGTPACRRQSPSTRRPGNRRSAEIRRTRQRRARRSAASLTSWLGRAGLRLRAWRRREGRRARRLRMVVVVVLLLVLRAAEEVDGCTFQRDKAGMVTAERRCAAIVRFVAVRSYSVHALGVVSLKLNQVTTLNIAIAIGASPSRHGGPRTGSTAASSRQ